MALFLMVHKTDPYYDSFWAGRDVRECVKEYFDSILDNLQYFSTFDSLGHFDYIVRYAPSSFHYEPNQYMDLIDAILRLLIKKDIALEVNTGGWDSKCGCQNPHFDILQHYASLGGELITIGSDAHTPEDISYRFDELPALLKKPVCASIVYTANVNRFFLIYKVRDKKKVNGLFLSSPDIGDLAPGFSPISSLRQL